VRILERVNLFPHYSAVLHGKHRPFYLICKELPVDFANTLALEELWKVHDEVALKFHKEVTQSVQKPPMNSNLPPHSFLDLKIAIANKLLQSCEFCENKCRVDRTRWILTQDSDPSKTPMLGVCGLGDRAYLSSGFLHHGEESQLDPIGTIFFEGCTFGFVFCQNYDISRVGKRGHSISGRQEGISPKELAALAEKLAIKGAKNINYVGGDPTPNLHVVLESMKFQTASICQLWNSNQYNTESAMKLLLDVMDFWLPDLKYGNNQCAVTYSKIQNYWEILTRNLQMIYDFQQWKESGSCDIIIRHLVMPGHFECCTKPILTWISKNIPLVSVNIMAQYHPEYLVDSSHYPEIDRCVTRHEMKMAFELADELGIEYRSVS